MKESTKKATLERRRHHQPRLTFSALAKLMASHTPTGHLGLLRQSKYPRPAAVLSYRRARRRIVSLICGQPDAPSGPLAPHERAVVAAFLARPLGLPRRTHAQPHHGPTPRWPLGDVDVSVFPDIDLMGPRGTGAIKLHLAQQPLARGVGRGMAALLHHHRCEVLGDEAAYGNYCIVYEVRTGRVHRAGTQGLPLRNLRRAEAACRLAAAVWPTL